MASAVTILLLQPPPIGAISNRSGVAAVMAEQSDLTALLGRAAQGDEAALQAVFSALYRELRVLAHQQVNRRGRGDFLDTTELVHESYLRFANAGRVQISHRRHFMGYAARVMRSVVVDTVRERQALRRGGGAVAVTLDTAIPAESDESLILEVHAALEELQALDERMVRVVEMRYFAGMTEAEVAETLGVTERTVRRIWKRAQIWLAEALSG